MAYEGQDMARRRNPLSGHLYLSAFQDNTLYKVQTEYFNQAWAAESICQRIYDELKTDFEMDDRCSPCPRQHAGFRVGEVVAFILAANHSLDHPQHKKKQYLSWFSATSYCPVIFVAAAV